MSILPNTHNTKLQLPSYTVLFSEQNHRFNTIHIPASKLRSRTYFIHYNDINYNPCTFNYYIHVDIYTYLYNIWSIVTMQYCNKISLAYYYSVRLNSVGLLNYANIILQKCGEDFLFKLILTKVHQNQTCRRIYEFIWITSLYECKLNVNFPCITYWKIFIFYILFMGNT